MESHPFQELCLSMYQNIFPEVDQISLRIYDEPVLKVGKSVATAEFLFVQDHIDSNPDLHEAANYLIIPSLLELTTNALANSVQTKLDFPVVWKTILITNNDFPLPL
ncbi:uncharacterized protein DS421_10g298180 [Arachis hypogaea]|nr:uncharacterized protein DS421_10g298180 [Arachis hypogaea]